MRITENFIKAVESEMKLIVGDNATVRIMEVQKNNGVVLHGVNVTMPGETICPTVYLENFVTEGTNLNAVHEIARDLIGTIANAREDKPKIETNKLFNFSETKERICFRIVNKERNLDMLSKMPYVDWNDLAIIFIVELGGGASFKVNDQIMMVWNTGVSELYELAKVNTPRLFPCEITSMMQMLMGMTGMSIDEFDFSDDMPMYVVTNNAKTFGASCLLYNGVLDKMAECLKATEIVILPSSVHEVICVPVLNNISIDEMIDMVREINATEVDDDEMLSNNVYTYSTETGKVTVRK